MMKKLLMALGCLIVLSLPVLADNAPVIGTWDCEIYVDMVGQTYPFKITLSEADGVLSGKASSDAQGETEMKNVKFENNVLTYAIDTLEAGTIEFKLEIGDSELKGTGGNWDFEGSVKGKKVQ